MKTPKTLDEKRTEAAMLKDIQPWDLLEYFESAVHDLEGSLQDDEDDGAEYLSDPRPFLTDLLGDFGDPAVFHKWAALGHDWEEVVTAALDNYLGVVKAI